MVNLQQNIQDGLLDARIAAVVASRSCLGVERAQELGLEASVISPRQFSGPEEFSESVFELVRAHQADLVVLAGFLSRLIIPEDYFGRVMNVHPSLIPAFCGQGMYGHHVHQAVIERGCKVSGCTVHFCDNEYDHGPIILQEAVPVLDGDDGDSLADRVVAAERRIYPKAVQLFSEGRLKVQGRRVLIDESHAD
ncbi:Phosphoribosylglycinamide formyltransferase [Thalassoglobus neptunius]|uniref:phosphoribosylglycinamide formyltransferase 1 n=2 Tax=Thalassoglobus neptunius TaxID=1938619 RepID=A0A5C5X928_9PLAN|nr:Phosphoribosylglycinamide formyltransferase [Thalassoglobus neptunius]